MKNERFGKLNKGFIAMLWNLFSILANIFIRRDESVVLVGAWMGTKFADNSRYLFQYLSENKELLKLKRVIWVTRSQEVNERLSNMGYEAYLCGSRESNYWHLKAGMHIICNAASDRLGKKADIDTKYSFGAIKVNLWHGTGALKAVGRSSNLAKRNESKCRFLREIKNFMKGNRLFDILFSYGNWANCYQIATAPAQLQSLYINYGRPSSRCIETSYPRNCPCPKLMPEEETLLERMKEYRCVLLYLPTFRTNSTFDFSGLAEELENVIIEKNILWIDKAHTAAQIGDVSIGPISKNIIHLSSDFDINVLVPHITVLLTDYSSVRMDAMFHRKATLFYVPDFEEYKNGDNGFFVDPNEVMCGPKLYTIDKLREAIRRYCDDPDSSKTANYEEIRSRYWSKNRSIAEIWEDICNAVGR